MVTELQSNKINYFHVEICSFTSLNSWKYYVVPMVESESASEVLPYHFEPVSVLNYNDNEDIVAVNQKQTSRNRQVSQSD